MTVKIKTKVNIHIPYNYIEDKDIVANKTELSRSSRVEFDINKVTVDVQRQLNLHSKDLQYEVYNQLKKRLNKLKEVKIK